jgi:hypothetical protein
MTFPLFVILIIYIVVIIIYLIFSAVLLYHIFRFGYWDSSTRLMVFLYFIGSLVIIIATVVYAIDIDWSDSITLFSNIEFNFSID